MYNLAFSKDAVLSPHAHEAFYGIIMTVYLIGCCLLLTHTGHTDPVTVNLMLSADTGRTFLCVTVSVLGVCDSRDNYCGDLVLINDRCPSTAYR